MVAMEDSFEAMEKETIEAKEDVQVNDVPAHSLSDPLEDLRVGKQMRWLVGLVETDKSTEAVFDLLWPSLDKGEHRLSVRRGAERHAVHFLIYKAIKRSWSSPLSLRRSALRLCTNC